jgi:hypothetical protein
MMNSPQ